MPYFSMTAVLRSLAGVASRVARSLASAAWAAYRRLGMIGRFFWAVIVASALLAIGDANAMPGWEEVRQLVVSILVVWLLGVLLIGMVFSGRR